MNAIQDTEMKEMVMEMFEQITIQSVKRKIPENDWYDMWKSTGNVSHPDSFYHNVFLSRFFFN